MKAILVIDEKPRNCAECELFEEFNVNEGFCKHMNGLCNCITDGKELPSWCPIKPMPEHYECEGRFDEGRAYAEGWNACLEELEK